jgi:hypothetical protein
MKTGTTTSPQQLWRTQFNRQLTDEMMERVLKQTIALVAKVQRRTPWRDPQTPDDRLHTAIVKTLDGTLKWDPTRVDLERHFLGAIAGEISHELEHAQKFRRVSLDDERDDSEELERDASDALSGQRESKQEVPKHVWWSAVMDEFRKHSNGDAGVLAIVDAYGNDKLTRREIIEFTGMSSRKYHAAYQRLMRTAQKIDDGVRGLIMQAIA